MTENTNFGYWGDLLANAPESYKQWFEQERKFLLANVPMGSRVLEVGSGDGRSLEYLSGIGRLYGVDYEPNAVLNSKGRFKGTPNISSMLEDGRDLPFRDAWFDRTLSMTTPVNFGEDRNKSYQEMRRVTKEDGEIIISVFNEDQSTLDERMKFYKQCEAPIKSIDGTTLIFDYPLGAGISEQFSEGQLRTIFSENRLTPLEIKKQGIGYFCRLKKF